MAVIKSSPGWVVLGATLIISLAVGGVSGFIIGHRQIKSEQATPSKETKTSNDSPTKAEEPTDGRNFWRFAAPYSNGSFKMLSNGKWEEIGNDGNEMGIWQEVSRTAEFVEIYDAKRNYKTRLGVGKAWLASGRDSTAFGPSPHGNWAKVNGDVATQRIEILESELTAAKGKNAELVKERDAQLASSRNTTVRPQAVKNDAEDKLVSDTAKRKQEVDLTKPIEVGGLNPPKAKELDGLKAKADLLRKPTATTNGGMDKVYSTPTELFADMPKEAYPKFGPMGGIERSAAKKWLKANVVGRTIEWSNTINLVVDDGKDPFSVQLLSPTKSTILYNSYSPEITSVNTEPWESFGGKFLLGDQPCVVVLEAGFTNSDIETRRALLNKGSSFLSYTLCSRTEVEIFRKSLGQIVTLRAVVEEVDVSKYGIISKENPNQVPIMLNVSLPSVNGFLPESCKQKKKK